MDDSLETFVPLTFRRRGSRRVAADDRDVHDVSLLEGIARGFYWQHLVDTGLAGDGIHANGRKPVSRQHLPHGGQDALFGGGAVATAPRRIDTGGQVQLRRMWASIPRRGAGRTAGA